MRHLTILAISILLLGSLVGCTGFKENPDAKTTTSEILTKHAGEVILLAGKGSGNLRLLHQRLGGTGEGPYPYGDLYIYTIPAEEPVNVIRSRYGS